MHYVRQGDAAGARARGPLRRAARRRRAVRRPAGRRPDRRARPAAARDDRRPRGAGRQRRRADGGDPASRSTSTAAPPSRPPTARTSSGSPTWSRSRPVDEAPSNLADHRPLRARRRRSSTCSARPSPGAAGRSSSPTRCARWPATAEEGGPVHGVVFRGRRYDTGDRADYLKARRCGSRASGTTSGRSSCPGCGSSWRRRTGRTAGTEQVQDGRVGGTADRDRARTCGDDRRPA